ncbi:hypothetical protein [Actinopolymorpha pittospori]|uniref:Uncharacterized protein n=1 Tax=Actinopolymorpha pittospori TaxID=648752 RepID=A0A927N2I8_9ACTN|nr:hypothetical protein [Actinopolymorpha pittospori]MBE1609773.1 hypothetical protein [Actinopolymorpha pittospori]
MPPRRIFRPNPTASVVSLIGLPLLTLIPLVVAVAALRAGSPMTIVLAGVFFVLAAIPAYLFFVMLRGWFSIEVDAEALSLHGAFGAWHLRLPWAEQEAVGMARQHKAAVLAVRPRQPFARAPRSALTWKAEKRLLLISSLHNWSAPADEIEAEIRVHAGAGWVEADGRPDWQVTVT